LPPRHPALRSPDNKLVAAPPRLRAQL
jgi:hypothetical protein